MRPAGWPAGWPRSGPGSTSGFEVVAEEIELFDRMEHADLVITGEGFIDAESFDGKVVGGVVGLAAALGIPVLAIAGRCFDGVDERVDAVALVDRFGEERSMQTWSAASSRSSPSASPAPTDGSRSSPDPRRTRRGPGSVTASRATGGRARPGGAHVTEDLSRMDATAQAALVRSGEVSPLELVDAAIAAIEKLNPELNAVIHGASSEARAEARADAARRRRSGACRWC